jgi:hypothetical protein
MYRSLGAVAAAFLMAAIVVPGPAAAAEQRQAPGIHKQVGAQEFSAQRRRYGVRRGYVGRGFAGRRFAYRGGFYRRGFYGRRFVGTRFYGRRFYGGGFYRPYYRPYPLYASGYPYGYWGGPFFRFGPFGFGFGRGWW